jgi:glucose-1-phosphate thymidylyltransferase
MRGVILAGGLGTRLKDFTVVSNKHLAPVYSAVGATPMIYYPIKTLSKSGIKEILIISSQEHSGDIIEYLGDGDKFGVEFTYKIQDMGNPKKPVGIASALKIAESYTGDENFAVILGDNYYQDTFAQEVLEFEDPWARGTKAACVFLKEVEDVRRFGCASVDGKGQVTKIVEKPTVPETNLAVTGLYLYTSQVYAVAETLKVSGRGELEITSINDFYAKEGALGSAILPGFWSDMGTPASMLHTQAFLQTHPLAQIWMDLA